MLEMGNKHLLLPNSVANCKAVTFISMLSPMKLTCDTCFFSSLAVPFPIHASFDLFKEYPSSKKLRTAFFELKNIHSVKGVVLNDVDSNSINEDPDTLHSSGIRLLWNKLESGSFFVMKTLISELFF
jgi:hypothetical protein